jgi:hypothetical protein
MRRCLRVLRARTSDRRAAVQLHKIQDSLWRRFIVRIINKVTATPPNAASTLPDGGPTVLRAITSVVPGERARIVRRIAMSSDAGVMLRHPEIRKTLHAGAARPQP